MAVGDYVFSYEVRGQERFTAARHSRYIRESMVTDSLFCSVREVHH